MADWYYAKDGQQHGPITSAQLRQMAQAGQLTPTDLVFREGGKDWVEANTVNGLFPPGGAKAVAAAAPAGGGNAFAFDDPAPPRGGGGRDDRDRDRGRDDRDRDRDRGRDDRDRDRGRDDRDRDRDYDRRDDYRDDDYPPPKRGGGLMGDVLMFRRMIAPWLIKLMYLVISVLIVLGGLIAGVLGMMAGRGIQILMSVGMILIGIPFALLFWRLYCEVFILFFQMNETLTDIRSKMDNPTPPKG